MDRFWRLRATDDGKPLNLYVATSDEAIRRDLASEPAGGLITIGRMSRFPREVTEDTNHRDLAAGAFGQAVQRKGIVGEKSFEEVSEIPPDLGHTEYGGYFDGPTLLVAVSVYWEWPKQEN